MKLCPKIGETKLENNTYHMVRFDSQPFSGGTMEDCGVEGGSMRGKTSWLQ